MSRSIISLSTAVLAITLASATIPIQAAEQDALASEAKVTQEQATRIALAKVPGGSVKSVELEREHGKLVWSFDLAQSNTKGVTEIQVDAIDGKVVSLKQETAAEEAKEVAKEAKGK